MPLALAKLLAGLLIVVLLLLLALWTYRYVQYRRAARLAQMRWLHFETTTTKSGDVTASFDWPSASETTQLLGQSHQMHILSPIIEERGRDSMDSLTPARRDRLSPAFMSYNSIEMP